MKFKKINEQQNILEMAQFGTVDKYTIWVYAEGDKANVPHFHFKSTDDEGCIKFETAEYFPHDGKDAMFGSIQRKDLVAFLQKVSDDAAPLTNWQFMVASWNTNNPKHKLSVPIDMPDYRRQLPYKQEGNYHTCIGFERGIIMRLVEDIELYKGIFWIVDTDNIQANKNYCFKIVSDLYGNTVYDDEFDWNYSAKSGTTYNHKIVWGQLDSKLTHNKPYNYYPRGRIEIHNGTAKIFLNGHINTEEVVSFLKKEFNLIEHNGIKKVVVIEDNSQHYLCHLDSGYKPEK